LQTVLVGVVLIGAERDTAFAATLPFGFLAEIFGRPWFSRMWVIQEVVMPNSNKVMFYCGDRMIHLTVLTAAVDWSSVPGLTPSQRHWFSYVGFIGSLKRAIAAQKSGTSLGITLSQVLALIRFKKATEPRDKVFALFGVAQRLGWVMPEPDYEKSQNQVFSEATVAALRNDQTLDILYNADGPRSSIDPPSWVPDFSQLPSTGNMAELQKFSASGESMPQISYSSDGARLVLKGVFVDVIHARASTLSWDLKATFLGGAAQPPVEMLRAGLSTVKEWIRFSQDFPSTVHGEPRNQAVAQTLFMDNNPQTALEAYFQIQGIQESILYAPHTLHQEHKATESTISTLEHLLVTNFGLTLVRTICGKVGTVSGVVAPEDIVVIFTGSKAPAVLRRKGDDFLLVGFAYIHGIMNGEVWVEEARKGLKEYTIV
jgi:hypothetical protein